jgi:uncharacterized protein (TIGR03435 family)
MWTALLIAFLAAQSGAGQSFEAASIKVAKGGRNGLATSPGRITGIATLKTLLLRAYGVKDYQVAGPRWIDSERYELNAKIRDGATREEVAAMLRTLLTERFRLVLRRESRVLPAYELRIAKSGPKVHASATGMASIDDSAPANAKLIRGADGLPELAPGTDVPRTYAVVMSGSDGLLYKVWARRETMPGLADRIAAQLGRPVIDASGLGGQYDFAFAWAVESAGGVVPRTGPPPDQIESLGTPVLGDANVTIFRAIEKQLGLTLRPVKRPIEMLIVEAGDPAPSGN